MGTLPQDTWGFEDALYAIQTANSAGFRTVGVYDAANRDDLDEIKRVRSDFYLEKLDNIRGFSEKSISAKCLNL